MNIESVSNQLVLFVTSYGLKIIGAIIILILGRIAAGICRRIMRAVLVKAKVEPSIVSFVSVLTYVLILCMSSKGFGQIRHKNKRGFLGSI